MRHAIAVAVLFLFAVGSLSAATFEPVSDAALVERADLVVLAQVLDASSRRLDDGVIVTDYRLAVEQALKGAASGTLVVTEAGGTVDGLTMVIPGSAEYAPGARVIAFLERRASGTLRTASMALGAFSIERRPDGIEIATRREEGASVDDAFAFTPRRADSFARFIRDVARGVETTPVATLAAPSVIESNALLNIPADVYAMTAGTPSRPIRWAECGPVDDGCFIPFVWNGDQGAGLNEADAVDDATDAWSSNSLSGGWIMRLANGNQNFLVTSATNFDSINSILFNNSTSQTPNIGTCDSGGALACGIVWLNGSTHTYDGKTWYSIIGGDVVIRPNSGHSQTFLAGVVAHELGHTMGLRHSNQGTPSTTNALMNSSVSGGPNLRQYDDDAMTEMYGLGIECVAPESITACCSAKITPGTTKSLTSTVTGGNGTFAYQWYLGPAGNTSNPLGTTKNITTPAINEPTSFWVKVTNECGTVSSNVVVVEPTTCTAPSITTEPQSQNVTSGGTATLSVVANGSTPLTYRWYLGARGDTSNPVGTNAAAFTTPPLTTTTSYWVQVENSCGTAMSQAAIITVGACTAPSITTGPQSQSISTGATATLSVVAGGSMPLTYKWYQGVQGDITKPVGTNAPSFTTPALTATTSYWVQVENSCGTAMSLAATITVGTCTPPSIHDMTPSLSSAVGQSVQLTVVPAGTGPFTYQWYRGTSPSTAEPIAGATNPTHGTAVFTATGTQRYWVKVTGACGFIDSPTIVVTILCATVPTPSIASPPASHITLGYDVTWTGNLAAANRFELQEARDAAFSQGVRTFTIQGTQTARVSAHSDVTTDTRFYYRVRAFSNCDNAPTAYSTPSSTIITRPLPETSSEFSITVPEDAKEPFKQGYLVPGFGAQATNGDTFSITTDAPWLTVFPASGALSAGGTTVELTINPSLVEIGTTTATVRTTRTQPSSSNVITNATTTSTSLPFSLSKVTPVTPTPRSSNPPEGTLIIPAVAHADGIGTRFQSDVRITNTSNDPITYEISFTPSAANGTHVGKRTTLTIAAGDTKAFDDIVRAWYGAGVLGELGLGTIEIRPQSGANPLATFAASRTYAVETRGTYGQFIPAIRTQSFIGPLAANPLAKLSLQQVANSATYRTNLGFVEGSGAPATLLVKLFGGNGQLLQQTTRTLPPYGHEQTNMALLFGDVALSDGRVEVSVEGGTGKATAYASVLDQRTKDPLLVFPVQAGQLAASRYVVPGVAELENGVASNFHSDMRLFNAGAAPVVVTLNYFPQRGDLTPRPAAIQRTIAAGQVLAIDNVLPSLWNLSRTGGSVTVDTPNDSSVVVTARTYSRDAANGTYGQFIPGVTAADAVGVGDRALQLLQLEQSEQYRTNLGLVEVTGNPATVEIIAFKPDSKTSALIHVPLAANEFVQFGRIFQAMGLPTVYNGRISVRTVDGAGRVAAYGSVVDNRTVDPTYVPSQ